MGAFPLLTSLTLLPPAVPAGVLTLPLLTALALLAPAPAEAQTPSPPTGFSGSGGTVVQYNSVIQTIGGSANFVNGHLLRVSYSSTTPSTRLVCGAGATLESGWYASSALTTRLGTGTILSPGSARIYRGDYTPSGGGEYQALAYCKTGTTYSTAVNLQGENRKFTLNAPTLTVSNRTQTGATLTIANHSADWWYKRTAPTAGTCTSRTAAQTTATLTSLTAGTSYTYKAYSKTGCNTADVIATATFDTLNAPTLTATNRTKTGATLTLANHSAAWWYKRTGPTAGTCTSRTAAQTTATLTGLTANTSYTYKAYSKASCNAADVIATATFSTLSTVTLTASNKTQTGATLTIANHSAAWWYKQTGPTAGTCTSRTAAQTTATLTGLTAGTSYTYKAYSKTGCNAADVIATAMFNTPAAATGFTARNNPIMEVEMTVGRNLRSDPRWRVVRITKVAGACHPYHSVENWVERKKARFKARYPDAGSPHPAHKVIGREPYRENSTELNPNRGWSNYCLEWNTVSGATRAFEKTEFSGVTSATNCTTALADNSWTARGFFNTGSKSKMLSAFTSGGGGSSTPYACHQVELRDGSGNVLAQSPAIHLKFGRGTATHHGSGYITAIDGTSGNYVAGAGSPGRSAPATAQVTLSTSPATVPEGTPVTVTATLSSALSRPVTIPLAVTSGTADEGDHGTLATITINGGSLSGSGTITTTIDADGDDETFTVAVDTANLPATVTAGTPVSKTVTITDSHEGEVSTEPIFPAAPATLTAVAGNRQVELSWGGVLLATGWEYSKDNGATWSTTGSTSTGTTVTGLSNGTSYNFKVRAVRQPLPIVPVQSGTASATATATPVAGNAPTGQPTLSGTQRVGHVLTAATSAIADQDGLTTPGWSYQWIRVEEGSTNTDITSATSSTYTLAAEDQGKKVRVKVTFTDDGSTTHTLESADSGVIAAAHTAVPEPVASVNVVHNGSSLTVSWSAPARATHYDVTYSGGGVNARAAWNRAATTITITCDSREGYENQNCVSGTNSYTVGVRARNAVGTSAWVNSAQVSFPAPDPVAAVRAVHRGNSLEVSWDAPARATHYDVTYSGGGVNARAAWNRAGESLEITCDSRPEHRNQSCVDSSATYTVGVRARNAGGESAWVNSPEAAPPALSVADATVAEPGEGLSATLDFVVTLSHAASAAVSVDYATSNGTATAGADYTAATGSLSFAAGETTKTVSVSVLNDAHNEGSETLTLTLSNAGGAVISDGTATGTITNDDPVPQAWISRFGRTMADQVLDAVDARMSSQPTPGLEMTLAGQPVQWPTGDGQPVAEQVVEQLAQWVSISSDGATGAVRSLHENDLLANSSFAFGSPTASGGLFSFWGRGAVSNFEGREGDLTLDGQVNTWMLGTDWSWGQWPSGGDARRSTAGLLLSRSSSDGSYDSTTSSGAGKVAATLTGVFPWGRHRFTERLEAWGAAGYGQGELEVTPKLSTGQDGATLTTDLNLWLAAAGLRGTLLDGGNHGITLTGKTDAMAVGTSSAQVTGANGNLAAADATVTRLRLGLEAQRPFSFGSPEADSRATLTPSLELGLRHDGGDAETGFGLDLGGGITLSHPDRGLQAEVRGRGLLTHAAEGFRDQGFSGSLSWQQRPDSDLGAMLSLTQTMGGSSSGGADALLSRVNLEGLTANNDDQDGLRNQRLELQLSYGLPAFGDRLTLTPEVGLGLYNSGRDYRIGWNLTQPDDGESFAFSFDATRREDNNGTAPEHGIELRLDTRF